MGIFAQPHRLNELMVGVPCEEGTCGKLRGHEKLVRLAGNDKQDMSRKVWIKKYK